MHETRKLPTCECGSNEWFVHTAIDPKGNYGQGCILEEFIVCQECERRIEIYKLPEPEKQDVLEASLAYWNKYIRRIP